MFTDNKPHEKLSARRQELCSRNNAQRVASRLHDVRQTPIAVVRTSDPLQPYRVADVAEAKGVIEVEIHT